MICRSGQLFIRFGRSLTTVKAGKKALLSDKRVCLVKGSRRKTSGAERFPLFAGLVCRPPAPTFSDMELDSVDNPSQASENSSAQLSWGASAALQPSVMQRNRSNQFQ